MIRRSVLAWSASLFLFSSPAHAAVSMWCDDHSGIAAIDGSIGMTEYPSTVSNGVNVGFGGLIGAGRRVLIDSDSSGNLVIALDSGATCTAFGADNTVVFYVDSIPNQGFTDTTGFDDNADSGRAAASAMGTDGTRADLTFARGFGADYAIVLRTEGAFLFRLRAGMPHEFLRTLTHAPEGASWDSTCARELGVSMTDLGSRAGNPIHWLGTLLNASTGFRSNELQGVADGTSSAGNIGAASFALANGDRAVFATEAPPNDARAPFAWIDFGTYTGSGFTPTPTCGQLSSNNWAGTGMSDGGGALTFGGTQTAGDWARGNGTAASVTGGFYSFQPNANDRGLGFTSSDADFTPGTLTLRLQNNAATTLTGFTFDYRVFSNNNQPRATNFDFAWSTDGTSFTTVPSMRVATPTAPDALGWIENTRTITVTALTLVPGGYIYVRFTSDDGLGSGSRDKVVIDDLVLTPVISTCGDLVIDAGELCDAGPTNGTTACGCQWSCTYPSSSTSCGPAGSGLCDLADTCDAMGSCADRVRAAGFDCRASTGACDALEECDGSAAECPGDGVEPAGTVCAAADDDLPCDLEDVCDGSTMVCAPRVRSAGFACRASTGICDLGGECDGASATCPASVPAMTGLPCRASTGTCDLGASCDGSLTCPASVPNDAGTPCRGSASICDAPESCNGASLTCPDDLPRAAGFPCRSSSGTCDAAESCDGSGFECPSDGAAPDGTPCLDGLVCNGAESCVSGVCGDGGEPICDDGDLCTSDGCGEPGGCFATPIPGCCNADADCDDGILCTTNVCSEPGGSCITAPVPGCCDEAADCGDGDLCTTDRCDLPSNRCVFDPIATCCNSDADCGDADVCSEDSCSGPGGSCTHAPIVGCCTLDAHCEDADLCTTNTCNGTTNRCETADIAGCCNLPSDCDDADLCTSDSCSGPGGTCTTSPISGCCVSDDDCADASACTADSCDETETTCVFEPIEGCCSSDADCADGNACTTDVCDSGTCELTPIENCCATDGDCDDGDDCTSDACGDDSRCESTAIASCCELDGDCDDGDLCTTDSCNEATIRCEAEPIVCDDGDECTEDSCVDGECEAEPICEDDAGTPAEDAGMPVERDSGSPSDAGARVDGGVEMDGGCGCRASRTDAPWWLALLAVLPLLRRRRR
jgi:MYXO-CTERM domain-containing protein